MRIQPDVEKVKRIRKLNQGGHRTQREIAQIVGCSQPFVCQVLAGQFDPPRSRRPRRQLTLRKLAPGAHMAVCLRFYVQEPIMPTVGSWVTFNTDVGLILARQTKNQLGILIEVKAPVEARPGLGSIVKRLTSGFNPPPQRRPLRASQNPSLPA